MLARYQIQRGRSLADLPARVRRGVRQDTRKHTRHCLRPSPELVAAFFAAAKDRRDAAAAAFERGYRALLRSRFAQDRAPFDALRDLASAQDVFLGCNCPTAANPDVRHCHTAIALAFMQERCPGLAVELPA
jgi:hypothetical protein